MSRKNDIKSSDRIERGVLHGSFHYSLIMERAVGRGWQECRCQEELLEKDITRRKSLYLYIIPYHPSDS